MKKVFEANISHLVANILDKKLTSVALFEVANEKLANEFAIANFFESQEEYDIFKKEISAPNDIVSEFDRAEYGDFQTNLELAKSVARFLKNKKQVNPRFVVEPTCGKGNFIIAAISTFSQVERIIGVEIYKPYIWEAKFNIIDFYISNPVEHKPEIEIYHFNVFDFDFYQFSGKFINVNEVLILGNPPWVTNSKLGSLDSKNLPKKSNFKNHSGFDAITGKGNFDIGEYITLMLFDAFQDIKGFLAFLVKNSVIKNLVFDQYQRKYRVSEIEKFTIDSKKEFDVSVEASLLFCKLNSEPQFTCNESNFYRSEKSIREFGWINNKFVSNTDLYRHSQDVDGVCPFEWRQGVKHDLSSVMELKRVDGYFINGKQEEIILEEDLVYGLLKSSDLKQQVIDQPKRFTIITQKKVGQDTSFIKELYPKTYQYLHSHKTCFDQRKSSIYNKKPEFSIFGIGDYSFLPFKVAISGLYKTFSFSLVLPLKGKPVMLDDTCYLLGFGNLEFAVYANILLNSNKTKEFLQAITFSDAKRTFTKDVLMRIDLFNLSKAYPKDEIKSEIFKLNEQFDLNVSIDKWEFFVEIMKPKRVSRQSTLF